MRTDIHQSFELFTHFVQRSLAALDSDTIASVHRAFEGIGFAQIPNGADEGSLAKLCLPLIDDFSTHFYHAKRALRPTLDPNVTGYSLRRAYFDPSDSDDAVAPHWAECLSQLRDGAKNLAAVVTPYVVQIAGDYSYHSGNMFLYCEGDYAGLHDDGTRFDRVNVQFPLTINSVGGIRVLVNEQLRMFYDMPGCLNLLGPGVWHEVPPLLRHPGKDPPRRVNLTLRFAR